jgi:hypothetical protein
VTSISPTSGDCGRDDRHRSPGRILRRDGGDVRRDAATGFTVNSATQITATAPAGTGTVDVRVTTAGGTSATGAADQYTYVGRRR